MTSYPILQKGSVGSYVEILQTRLGYWGIRVSVDGDFGPSTEAAVKKFQSHRQIDYKYAQKPLPQSGVVEQLTWAELTRTPIAALKILEPGAELLSLTDLIAIARYASRDRLQELQPFINATLQEFEIIYPLRIAHFIAQVAHESDGFNALEEYATGEDYEGRADLGNTHPGDGVRFKGRGLIQVTGRTNYWQCGQALGVDLLSNPTVLANPDLACRSAGWYWRTRSLNVWADRDDVHQITRLINGGYNGLDDRISYLGRAKRCLKI